LITGKNRGRVKKRLEITAWSKGVPRDGKGNEGKNTISLLVFLKGVNLAAKKKGECGALVTGCQERPGKKGSG